LPIKPTGEKLSHSLTEIAKLRKIEYFIKGLRLSGEFRGNQGTAILNSFILNPNKTQNKKQNKQNNTIHMKPTTKKLTPEGEYVPFFGATVVSALNPVHPFSQRTFDGLKSIGGLEDYYALLPPTSYHKTTMVVKHERDFRGSKEDFLTNLNQSLDFYSFLNESLERVDRVPTISFRATDDPIGVNTCISYIVSIDQRMAKEINLVAQRHKLQKRVPKHFHITLAYLYKEISEEERERISLEIRRKLGQLMEEFPEIQLERAQLCFHRDMTAFIPWDGRRNPFD
jgi:hypothetical protein